MAKNYYEILGVDKKASQDDIKAAYRKLVKQYHPDLHPGDAACAEKFKEINEANEVLSDEKRRKQYDFELDHPASAGFGGGFGGGAGFDDIFSEIFKNFGGNTSGSAKESAKEAGEDIQVKVSLSFLDAAKGCKKEINYVRNEPCHSCKGTGAKNGTAFKVCDKCKGKGQIQYVSNSGFFRQVSVRPCPDCGGTGKKIIEKCPDCGGKGFNRKNSHINIDVPAGADTNSYMQIRGYGEASKTGGPAGNLIIVFSVEPHKLFKRKNFDLYVDVPISYKTATLGGVIKVPTIDSLIDYPIAEGTPNGRTFVLKGKGIHGKSGTGDLYVTVVVDIPTKLTKEQKKKLEEMDRDTDLRQCLKMKSYSDSVESLYGTKPY